MTSYRFFKMAVIESEIYFRFRFWWWYSLGKIEIYWHTKFQWDISIHDWDKTTSGFGKRTAAIWISISGFCFYLIFVIGVSFCIGLPYFVKIEQPLAELWRHIDFFKIAAGSHIGFDLDNIRPPSKCNCWSEVGPQIWSWSDSQVRRYCNFYILPFWLEIAYSRPFFGSFGGYISPRWRHTSSWPPKGTSLRENTSFEP